MIEFRHACEFLATTTNNVIRRFRKTKTSGACILASRIVCESLSRLGFGAEPKSVCCFVGNKEAGEFLGTYGRFAEVGDAVSDRYKLVMTDIGTDRSDVWQGHLVVLTTDGTEQFLVDPCLSDFARPDYGIKLSGKAWPFDVFPYTMQRDDGVIVRYEEINDDRWRDAMDWTAKGETVDALVYGALAAIQMEAEDIKGRK